MYHEPLSVYACVTVTLSVCVFVCVYLSICVCVAIFSIYILNINYVNSSALVFIIHNGPCAKVISKSVERIAICIHEHLLGSPAECCWPAIKPERVYNTHKEVGQGNLASDWPFWKAQFKKNIYISTRSLPVCRQTSKIPYTLVRERNFWFINRFYVLQMSRDICFIFFLKKVLQPKVHNAYYVCFSIEILLLLVQFFCFALLVSLHFPFFCLLWDLFDWNSLPLNKFLISEMPTWAFRGLPKQLKCPPRPRLAHWLRLAP